MARIESVNIAVVHPTSHSDMDTTGIDKHPVGRTVAVSAPVGPSSGLAGDVICDVRHHGGPDQAVYAYAREDYDDWAAVLGRDLRNGMFGENLTTSGVDVNGAVVGERWRIGSDLELEVSVPRIPCRTFAGWLGEQGWVRTFTERATPGTYLRVITPGTVTAGDSVKIVHRPAHGVTIRETFQALTTHPQLLPRLLEAPELPVAVHDRARRRT